MRQDRQLLVDDAVRRLHEARQRVDSGEVEGRRRGVDGARIAGAGQERQPARMVEMGMRQQHRVQLGEGARFGDAIVILELARALKEAEVHEDVGVSGLEQVGRTGDFTAAGAMDRDLHANSLSLGL